MPNNPPVSDISRCYFESKAVSESCCLPADSGTSHAATSPRKGLLVVCSTTDTNRALVGHKQRPMSSRKPVPHQRNGAGLEVLRERGKQPGWPRTQRLRNSSNLSSQQPPRSVETCPRARARNTSALAKEAPVTISPRQKKSLVQLDTPSPYHPRCNHYYSNSWGMNM